jgi:hypothetical protein
VRLTLYLILSFNYIRMELYKLLSIAKDDLPKKFTLSKGKIIEGKLESIEFENKQRVMKMNIRTKGSPTTYMETVKLPIYVSLEHIAEVCSLEIVKLQMAFSPEIQYSAMIESKTGLEKTTHLIQVYTNIFKTVSQIRDSIQAEHHIKMNHLLRLETQLRRRSKNEYNTIVSQSNEDEDTRKIRIQQYLKTQQAILNSTQQTEIPGSRVRYNGNDDYYFISNTPDRKSVHIMSITEEELTVPRNEIIILPSIQNMIFEYKHASTHKPQYLLRDVLAKISSPDERAVLLRIMELDESILNTVDQRTIPSILPQESIKQFITSIDNALYDETSSGIIIPDRLSILNSFEPFKVHHFTFASIAHYTLACKFYNRRDLNHILYNDYNNIFKRFTREYSQQYGGVGSLYSLPIHRINAELRTMPYVSHSIQNWYTDSIPTKIPSLVSVYTRKAYYHKIMGNLNLKSLLLSTNNEKLVSQDSSFANELMEVRYYIKHGIEPPYKDFNIDSSIEEEITHHVKQTFLIHKIHTALISNTSLQQAETGKLEHNIQMVLHTYIGQRIFEIIHEFRTLHPSLDDIIKQYPILNEHRVLAELIYDVVIMNETHPEKQTEQLEQIKQRNMAKQHIEFQNIYPKPFHTIYDVIEHQISYQNKMYILPNKSGEIEKMVLHAISQLNRVAPYEPIIICKLISRLLGADILFLDGTSILYSDMLDEFADMGSVFTHPQIIISMGISNDKIPKYTSIIPNPKKLTDNVKILLHDSSNNQIYENIEIVDGNEQLLLGVWDERTSTIISIDNSQQSQQSPTSDSKSVIIDELLFSKMKWIDGKDYYFYKNIIVGQYEL